MKGHPLSPGRGAEDARMEEEWMRSILITSVGSLVGHNILESLAPRRQEWRVIGVNSLPLAASFSSPSSLLRPFGEIGRSEAVFHGDFTGRAGSERNS